MQLRNLFTNIFNLERKLNFRKCVENSPFCNFEAREFCLFCLNLDTPSANACIKLLNFAVDFSQCFPKIQKGLF